MFVHCAWPEHVCTRERGTLSPLGGSFSLANYLLVNTLVHIGKKSPVYGKWKEFYFVIKYGEQKLLFYERETVSVHTLYTTYMYMYVCTIVCLYITRLTVLFTPC